MPDRINPSPLTTSVNFFAPVGLLFFLVLVPAARLLFYLVLFSYSLFLNGITGLAITIGSVVTLAVLMRLTAKLDWSTVVNRTAKQL